MTTVIPPWTRTVGSRPEAVDDREAPGSPPVARAGWAIAAVGPSSPSGARRYFAEAEAEAAIGPPKPIRNETQPERNADERAVRLAEEHVIAPRSRQRGRQLAERQGPAGREHPAEDPEGEHELVAADEETVNPEVVRTPVPTMLETTTKVAVARPKPGAFAARPGAGPRVDRVVAHVGPHPGILARCARGGVRRRPA